MSSRPSASNSDLYVNGDPAFPVFDDGYSKFEVTEKRLSSDDVICLPASEVRAVCPDLMPKPMPRPIPGCPTNNFGPNYPGGRYPGGNYPGGNYPDYGTFGPDGRFDVVYDPRDPIGGDGPRPKPTQRPPAMQLYARPDGMYHGRHVTARGLKPTRFNEHTLVSPKARGGPLRVTISRAKGNAITGITLGGSKLVYGRTALVAQQTTMSFNVPVGYHINTQKAGEAGWWRDPPNQSTSISLAQATAGQRAVYTKTRAAFVRRPGEMVRGRPVINRARVSDIVMEKRLKMLGANSFSYGVTLTYPRTHKFVTTRTSVFKSVSPRTMNRVTALNMAGRWVSVPLSARRKHLSVVQYQAVALSTVDGKKSIGVSLHDFPKSKAGNWFKPYTSYAVRLTPGGISWALGQQLGRRGAVVLGWERQGKKGRRVQRKRVLPVGKFSFGMTWTAGSMAQVQDALRKAAATKGRQADSNIVDVTQQRKECTVKKVLNKYCKNLKCKNNDKRGACAKCMNCKMVNQGVQPGGVGTRVCTVKKVLNQYCKNLKCKNNDKRGACLKCMDCKFLGLNAAQLKRIERNKRAQALKNKNKKCKPVDSPECAGCTVNDPLPECQGCTVCN